MASLVVLLIVLGCAALLFFKGTLTKAVAAIIVAIIAGMISFNFFEAAANMIISRGDSGSLLSIAPWAQTLCFLLIFVVVFALMLTGVLYLLREPIDFGVLPEYIGRAVCGIVLGFIVSGFLLTALAMGPLPLKYPYQRFDPRSLKPDDPKGVLLNADGFATGLFSTISKGSFSGKRSFSVIHPNYLDQLFFNRLINTDTSSIISSRFPAITVPRQAAVWDAPKAVSDQANALIGELKSRGGKIEYAENKSVPLPVSTQSGDIKIVRVGIKKAALRGDGRITGGTFTPAQLRLICKRRGSGDDRLGGEAVNVYPIGHLKTAEQIQVVPQIKLESQKIEASEQLIDFVFSVPSGHEPVLVQYKMNSIVEILPQAIVTDPAKIPAPALFNASSGGGGNRNRGNRNRNRPSGPDQQ
ncbi:MAG TPA: hypothetical protein ENI81_01050, partial [Phycisphaerales bacterium]|nr:hypothetical protein [Phycisphaerales bacterium]